MRQVLQILDHPENNFPIIHVAGTNGKGSVCAILHSILSQSQEKIGLYTSPHLEKINERFQVGGRCITDSEFARIKNRIQQKVKHLSFRLTEFELLTLIAFQWFSEQGVFLAVMEVGLGGRLDATNVVPHVLLSIITTISLEHTEWLGSTIQDIAKEKAGIIKTRVPVVTATTGKALDVIRSVAQKRRSPLIVAFPPSERYSFPLVGPHQQRNLGCVLAALSIVKSLFPHWTSRYISEGLKNVKWPGRFEKIRNYILDGAHNPGATKVLCRTLKENRMGKIKLLFGVLRDKNIAVMARHLSSYVSHGVVVNVKSSRSANASHVSRLEVWRHRMKPMMSAPLAMESLEKESSTKPILVTGSLYLVGEVREILRKRGWVK